MARQLGYAGYRTTCDGYSTDGYCYYYDSNYTYCVDIGGYRFYSSYTNNVAGNAVTNNTNLYKDRTWGSNINRYYGSGTAYKASVYYVDETYYVYDYSFAKGTGVSNISRSSWTGESGTSTTCTASVSSGYVFDGWYFNGSKVSSSTTLTITAGSSPEGTYTAYATYNLATITVNYTGAGGSVSGGGTYTKGTQVTIKANVPDDKRFLYWTDGSTAATRTITATSDTTYTAVFSSVYVSVSSNDSSLGVAYVGASGIYTTKYYAAGDSVILRADINDASTTVFRGWRQGNNSAFVSTSQVYTTTFTGSSTSYTAVFARKQLVVAASPSSSTYGQTKVVYDGTEYSNQATVTWGRSVTLRATIRDYIDSGTGNRIRGSFLGWYAAADVDFLTLLSDAADFTFAAPSNEFGTKSYVARFAEAEIVQVTAVISDGENATPGRGTIEIDTSNKVLPDDPTSSAYYTGVITFTATPAVGYYVAGWLVNGSQITGSDSSQNLQIQADTTVTAVILKKSYPVSYSIDDASFGAGTIKLQTYDDNTWSDALSDTVEHGTRCRILVALASGSDHVFRKLVSDGNTLATSAADEYSWLYEFDCIEAVEFVAYFGQTFTVAAMRKQGSVYDEDEYGTVKVATSQAGLASASDSVDFTYGDTLYLEAIDSETEGETAYFVAWRPIEDGEIGDKVLDAPSSYSLAVTTSTPISWVAEFKASPEMAFIRLSNSGTSNGVLSISTVSQGGDLEQLTPAEFDDGLDEYYGITGSPSATNTSDTFWKVRAGTPILISCVATNPYTRPFLKWLRQIYAGRATFSPATPEDFGTAAVQEVVATNNAVYYARYNTSNPTRLTLRYCSGSSKSDGSIYFLPAGDNPTQTDISVTGEIRPGESVSIIALPRSGYKFAGWYSDVDGENRVSESATHGIEKDSVDETFYAKFAQDVNAIYKWEGSQNNKMLSWRSKTTVLPQPVNFSAAQICADGYPLTIRVHSASSPSPDRETWQVVEIDVEDSRSRKLPCARPERYVEVEVLSRHEVQNVQVGTSITGFLEGAARA